MKRVLIVDDSIDLLESLALALENSETGFNLVTATNGEEAVKIIHHQPISVLITDLNMPKMDGLELLIYMNQNHPEVPCIVITGYASPDLDAVNKHLGIYAFLEKPITLEILLKNINGALNHIDQNNKTSGVSTAGFLELINIERKSCLLLVSHPTEGDGRFSCVGGELYSAQCGDVHGDKAVVKMLCWENVTSSIESLASELIAPDVTCSLQSLILKADNLKSNASSVEQDKKDDEKNAIVNDGLLNKAIRLVEGGNSEHAQPILVKFLKQNSNNADAWLWFSRISNKMKAITVGLKNASCLAPNNSEIQEEIRMVNKAIKAGCKEDDTVKRCPFCWMPAIESVFACSNCKAQLFLPKKITKPAHKTNRYLLEKAALRFTRNVIFDRNNYKSRFYLGVAHYNLGNWGEAATQLHKTKALNTTNEFYSQQLGSLLDYMAFLESTTHEQTASPLLDGSKKTILIVDDSSTIRKVLRSILSKEGFEIIEAKNGIDALAKLNEVIPALILLDIIMPEMDGYEVLSTIKKSNAYKDIPIIMLTAKDNLISKVKGKLNGCNDYLTKPCSSKMLTTKIMEHLQ